LFEDSEILSFQLTNEKIISEEDMKHIHWKIRKDPLNNPEENEVKFYIPIKAEPYHNADFFIFAECNNELWLVGVSFPERKGRDYYIYAYAVFNKDDFFRKWKSVEM
jgi:hypothetical protein